MITQTDQDKSISGRMLRELMVKQSFCLAVMIGLAIFSLGFEQLLIVLLIQIVINGAIFIASFLCYTGQIEKQRNIIVIMGFILVVGETVLTIGPKSIRDDNALRKDEYSKLQTRIDNAVTARVQALSRINDALVSVSPVKACMQFPGLHESDSLKEIREQHDAAVTNRANIETEKLVSAVRRFVPVKATVPLNNGDVLNGYPIDALQEFPVIADVSFETTRNKCLDDIFSEKIKSINRMIEPYNALLQDRKGAEGIETLQSKYSDLVKGDSARTAGQKITSGAWHAFTELYYMILVQMGIAFLFEFWKHRTVTELRKHHINTYQPITYERQERHCRLLRTASVQWGDGTIFEVLDKDLHEREIKEIHSEIFPPGSYTKIPAVYAAATDRLIEMHILSTHEAYLASIGQIVIYQVDEDFARKYLGFHHRLA